MILFSFHSYNADAFHIQEVKKLYVHQAQMLIPISIDRYCTMLILLTADSTRDHAVDSIERS
jgi:hypothetical protein